MKSECLLVLEMSDPNYAVRTHVRTQPERYMRGGLQISSFRIRGIVKMLSFTKILYHSTSMPLSKGIT